jgi:hypothetical protein
MKVSARALSVALVSGMVFLVACANGDVASGEDPTGDWIADGGLSQPRDAGAGGGGALADAGATPPRDAGTTTPGTDAGSGTPTVDAGTGACTPQYSTGNQACSDCSRSQCCSSMNAFFADASYSNFSTCLNGCGGTTSCVQTCKQQYPGIGAKFDAYYGCTQISCQAACGSSSGGGGGGGGTCTPRYNVNAPAACNTCLRTQCCASMNAFFDEPEAMDFLDCLDLLGLPITTCQLAFPNGARVVLAYDACITSSCAVACP